MVRVLHPRSPLWGGLLHAAGLWWGYGICWDAALVPRRLGVVVLAEPVGSYGPSLPIRLLVLGGPLRKGRWHYHLSYSLLSPTGRAHTRLPLNVHFTHLTLHCI